MTDYLYENCDYASDYSQDDVWRKWLCTRTRFSFKGKPYSWIQTAYHYSKNQKYLECEIDRYNNGNLELDYDWIDSFNKDSEHYRLNEFFLVCFIYEYEFKHILINRSTESFHDRSFPRVFH